MKNQTIASIYSQPHRACGCFYNEFLIDGNVSEKVAFSIIISFQKYNSLFWYTRMRSKSQISRAV